MLVGVSLQVNNIAIKGWRVKKQKQAMMAFQLYSGEGDLYFFVCK